jgi:hypothetical protein
MTLVLLQENSLFDTSSLFEYKGVSHCVKHHLLLCFRTEHCLQRHQLLNIDIIMELFATPPVVQC